MSRRASDGPRVAVVGSLHYDVMVRAPRLPRIGETLIGDAWWWKLGGKGGNQAVAAARHGARVSMIGSLGDDDFGARVHGRLAAEDIDLAHLRRGSTASGMSVAIEQADGDYAAVVVSGANRSIDADQVGEASDAIGDAHVLVLQNEIGEAANVAAADIARAAGTTVVLNAAPARPMRGLADRLDVLVVNAIEAEMLGAGVVDSLERAVGAARDLRHMAPIVIVTVGAAGVAVASDAGDASLAALGVEPLATHGAGDVFVGALAARLAMDEDLAAAMRYANAAAGLHVGTPEAERDRLGADEVGRRLG